MTAPVPYVQVWEAVRVAQKHGDLCLSLVLTQVTGSHEARQLVRSQVENWRQVRMNGGGVGRATAEG